MPATWPASLVRAARRWNVVPEVPARPRIMSIAIVRIAASAFALAAVFIVARRAAGSFVAPLPSSAALFAGGALALGAWSIRRALDHLVHAAWWNIAALVAPVVIALAAAAALTTPGSLATSFLFLWGPVLLVVISMLRGGWWRQSASTLLPAPAERWSGEGGRRPNEGGARVATLDPDQEIKAAFPASRIAQKTHHGESGTPSPPPLFACTYTRTEAGQLRIHGQATVTIEPGQKLAQLHIAFCPAFARIPEIEAWTDDKGMEVVVSKSHLWGARLDVKSFEPLADGRSVEVTFDAAENPS